MSRLINISSIAGFFTAVALLVATAFYASALRQELAECRSAHLSLSNEKARCENGVGALRNKLSVSAAELRREQRVVAGLEARLEAAGAARICAASSLAWAG